MHSTKFVLLSGIALLGSGVVLANIVNSEAASSNTSFQGEVVRFYGSDTLVLEGHKAMIKLANSSGPARNYTEENRRLERLNDMVSGQIITCNLVDIDSYGVDVAECSNARGESLNQALATVTSITN